ncbi:MAG: Endonuclease I [Parcubacteria group bacterium GW2011_GWC2_42_11]|nr:MAG: Endonuclease I [Parcubacteria group bacterium GW2011_GWC2_42_11]
MSRKTREYSIILVLLLLGGISFGLGRLSATKPVSVPVTLCASETVSTIEASAISAPLTSSHKTSQYVGSKNGTVYHLPWCGGARRIREENKVWFATKEEAEQAGYRPATNCKGL